MGFEPMTSVQRSTNWANKPTGSWSMNWVQINIQVSEEGQNFFQVLFRTTR